MRVQVYWTDDDAWYSGEVRTSRDGATCIRYDPDFAGQPMSARVIWHDMNAVQWRVPHT